MTPQSWFFPAPVRHAVRPHGCLDRARAIGHKVMSEGQSIDVEQLMRRIRENIKRKRVAEAPPSSENPVVPLGEGQTAADFAYLRSGYNIQDVSFASPRGVIGPFVVAVKNILRRLLASILERQTAYNAASARVAAHIQESIETLDRRQAQAGRELKSWIEAAKTNQASIRNNHTELQERVSRFESRLGQELVAIESRLRGMLAAQSLHATASDRGPALDRRGRHGTLPGEGQRLSREGEPELDDPRVEERPRESEEGVKARQRVYLQYFEGRDNVIHLGCGRGEFLELLRESGITARGVDLDLDMILRCREKGLDASRQDVFACIGSLPDNSVGGILAAEVVGQLDPRHVTELIKLCFVKLAPGGVLVFETPSPECLVGSAGTFSKDVTHAKPVHPDTMQFVFEASGFHEVELRFSEIEWFNHGVERLNSILSGFADCAVIGRKAIKSSAPASPD
jgi:SAM-dependent methyltransferase